MAMYFTAVSRWTLCGRAASNCDHGCITFNTNKMWFSVFKMSSLMRLIQLNLASDFYLLFCTLCFGVLFYLSLNVSEYFTVFSRHFICGISLFFPYVDALAFSGPEVKNKLLNERKHFLKSCIQQQIQIRLEQVFSRS